MLLSGRILTDVGGVNIFDYAESAQFTEGDAPSIYIQLIDVAKDQKLTPPGRRYMPAAGALLEVTIGNVDTAKVVTRTASQPFSNDPSIWKIYLLTTDPVRGTVDVTLKLTEGAVITRGYMRSAIRALPQQRSFC